MPSGYRLIIGSPAATTLYMQRLLVRLAVHGRVRWLMCGNFFNIQRLIYDVALQAGATYYEVLENNIAISRAETCYQVIGLLRKSEAAKTPTFISDLLVQFYDEKIHDDEAIELFDEGIQLINQLSLAGPVIVSASGSTERSQLYTMLLHNADRITRIGGDANHGS